MERLNTRHMTDTATVLLLAIAVAAVGLVVTRQPVDSGAASSTRVIANRVVFAPDSGAHKLLVIPGLGTLKGYCPPGTDTASIRYANTTRFPVDMWVDLRGPGDREGRIWAPNQGDDVAIFQASTHRQDGAQIELGRGNSPGARRTAVVTANAYREGPSAACGFQATATTWRTR